MQVPSINKNQIKYFASLKIKKFRDEAQLFVAEGEKLAQEIIIAKKEIRALIAVESWLEENQHLLRNARFEIFRTTEADFERISNFKTPNRVLLVLPQWHYSAETSEMMTNISLMLDDIQDPGNLGTIVRLADWFGIKHIICSEKTADLFNPKVIQSTMGAFLRVKLMYTHLPTYIEHVKKQGEIQVFGAFLEGKDIYQSKLTEPAIILMGNESKGICKELEKVCDHKITIPSYSNNGDRTESLNVAVATAIICAEFRRVLS
jgi:TrmH family RNA methyltransferase